MVSCASGAWRESRRAGTVRASSRSCAWSPWSVWASARSSVDRGRSACCAMRRRFASEITEGAKSSASDRLPILLDEVTDIGEGQRFWAAADAGPQRLHCFDVRVLHPNSHERLTLPFLFPDRQSVV